MHTCVFCFELPEQRIHHCFVVVFQKGHPHLDQESLLCTFTNYTYHLCCFHPYILRYFPRNFKPAAKYWRGSGWWLSCLVVNQEDSFSRVRLQCNRRTLAYHACRTWKSICMLLYGLLRYKPIFCLTSSQGLGKPVHLPSLFKES